MAFVGEGAAWENSGRRNRKLEDWGEVREKAQVEAHAGEAPGSSTWAVLPPACLPTRTSPSLASHAQNTVPLPTPRGRPAPHQPWPGCLSHSPADPAPPRGSSLPAPSSWGHQALHARRLE